MVILEITSMCMRLECMALRVKIALKLIQPATGAVLYAHINSFSSEAKTFISLLFLQGVCKEERKEQC